MAVKYPAPSPPFIEARFRGGYQVPKGIVLHGTVSPDNPGTARNIATWWHGPTSPQTSAHYVVDPKEDIQCVGDHTVAYHCGYNTGTIAIELCDEQQGPVSRWRDADSKAIVARAARLTAELCLAYNIEARRPTVAELKAKGPHGIYGHNDSRLAFGHTTHSDPRDFDWDSFLSLVRKEIEAIKRAASGQHRIELPKTVRLDVAHTSLQFSDKPAQHTADIEKIFGRAQERKVAWVTGTESGPGANNTSDELVRLGAAHGYRMWVPSAQKHGKPGWATDAWIAVRADLVTGGWETGFHGVIPGSAELYKAAGVDPTGKPKWGPKGLVDVSFQAGDLGHLNVGAGHYLTKGHHPGAVVAGIDHWAWNQKLGLYIGEWAKKVGAGKALAFYGGDQNMVDSRDDAPEGDSFFGQPLTSVFDELKNHESTGHGAIDVIASYDADGRVKAAYARALDDKEFALNTDHFLVEAGFDVTSLKAA